MIIRLLNNTSLNSLYSSSGMIFSIEYRARTRRDPGSIPFSGIWELSRNHSSVACPFCNLLNWQRINTTKKNHYGHTITFSQSLSCSFKCFSLSKFSILSQSQHLTAYFFHLKACYVTFCHRLGIWD